MKQTITLFLILNLMFSCSQSNNRTELLVAENENLKIKIDSLTKLRETENGNLAAKIDSLSELSSNKKTETNYWFIPSYDGKKLIRSGINNPEEFIENALREKPERIPLKAVLGGTMNYGTIQVLSEKWLIADFNDGHIEGKAIYKYTLKKNGALEFQLIEMTDNSQ